tara:strand:+ start:445 stop:765 length:321 start_codon:yes stop_codon:yes gene_type:complete
MEIDYFHDEKKFHIETAEGLYDFIRHKYENVATNNVVVFDGLKKKHLEWTQNIYQVLDKVDIEDQAQMKLARLVVKGLENMIRSDVDITTLLAMISNSKETEIIDP